MTPIELLKSTEVFSSMPQSHLEQLASRLERKEFMKGAKLVFQGAPGDALYIIEKGQVGIYTRDDQFGLDVEMAELGPGDCLGELSIITGAPRTATCMALTDTVAYRLDRTIFEAVLGQSQTVQRDLIRVLAKRLAASSARQGIPFVSLLRFESDPSLFSLIPEQIIKRYQLVPIAIKDGAATVAAVDPSNSAAFAEVRRYLQGMRINPVAVSREDFQRYIEKAIGTAKVGQVQQTATSPIHFLSETEESDRATIATGPEILEMLNRIITTGIDVGASDIHIEPGRGGTQVRYRIHGALEKRIPDIPLEAHRSLLSRIKVLARMDITETRKTQEGRISLETGGRTVDLRLSFVPTSLGQKVVMRILDSRSALLELDKLILAERVRQVVRTMFYAPHGVVLITGPTGSGKTTTMYSALLERRNAEINIVTVEDPVEFHLDGLTQVEIGATQGLDFSAVLRSFLRQDPDIILVGETRDAETAKLALQAGLTGHLVFTSYHTNDCISAVVRMFEMGMEPFALANALVGVIHQRLIRRICPHCKVPFEYFSQVIENLRNAGIIGTEVPTMYRSKGCDHCMGQGYLGRVAAFEVLVVTDPVRAAIARQASPEEILSTASEGAFVSLSRYLRFLIKHGITAPGEVLSALPKQTG